MTSKTNNAEGGTNGATVTQGSGGNSGGASGDYFAAVVIGTGATLVFDNTTPAHGALCYAHTGATGANCRVQLGPYTGQTSFSLRFYIRFTVVPTVTTSFCDVLNSASSVIVSLDVTAAGKFSLFASGVQIGAGSAVISANTWYRLECQGTIGSTTANGVINFDSYNGDSTTSFYNAASSAANMGTTANTVQAFNYGKNTSSSTYASTFRTDDLAARDGNTVPWGVAPTNPTAAFTSNATGLTTTFDATGSTAISPATVASYAWTYGDAGTGTGATPSHTYASAGTYTVGLTVTDSNGLTDSTSASVTVNSPSGTGSVASITVGTNWTPSTGTALACITDGDPTTFITSSSPPTAQEFDFVLSALTPPATGQPLKVFLTMDAPTSSSASLAAQLFEGATQRSSLTGVTIPAGSGSTVLGAVVLTFPWTDVSAVSTGGWNGLTVKLQVTAA